MARIRLLLLLVLLLSTCSFNGTSNPQSSNNLSSIYSHTNLTDNASVEIHAKSGMDGRKTLPFSLPKSNVIVDPIPLHKVNKKNYKFKNIDFSMNRTGDEGTTNVQELKPVTYGNLTYSQGIRLIHPSTDCINEKEAEHILQYDISYAVISTFAFVVGTVGNFAVLFVSYLHRDKLSKCKHVIALLAFTDCLSCVLNFLHTFHLFFSGRWVLGVFLCKTIFTGMMICSWLSSGFILIITLERFFGVVHSMKKSLQGHKLIYMCAAVNLVLAISAGVPMVITTNVNQDGLCHNYATRSLKIPYQWCLIVVFVIAPVCAIVHLYFKILHFLLVQSRNSLILSREDLKVKRMKNNRHTVKIIVPIVVLFVLCVLPMHAVELYIAYWSPTIKNNTYRFNVYKILGIIQNITFPLHACVNPIVYTIMDRGFRNDLLAVLQRKRKVVPQLEKIVRPHTI